MLLKDFKYRGLIKYFEEVSSIPRATFDEARIAEYICDFARERGFFCLRDGHNNVFVRMPASRGREGEEAILLQGHTDMVCEKNAGVSHDFSKDGIELYESGGFIRAKGTTLGADNGTAVAIMLYVLDGAEGNISSHPTIECLFTASEEKGLVGAGAFDYSVVTATRMINMDSADESEIIVGCAGGQRSELITKASTEANTENAFRLSVKGLFGGHSGEDIHKGRANALVLMGRILSDLALITPFRLVSITGGDKDNAIPRDCVAVILPDDLCAAKRFFGGAEAILSREITSSDDAARRLCVKEASVSRVASAEDTARLLSVLSVRNGVLYERTDGKNVPETSRNLAAVKTGEGELDFSFSSRSPIASRIDECTAELEGLAARVGGTADHRARYPGWEGAADSPVSLLWQTCYRELTGREITTTVIHAGLECGLISSRIEGLDVISLGCNVHDLHTPAESMELPSLERVYQTLLSFLERC